MLSEPLPWLPASAAGRGNVPLPGRAGPLAAFHLWSPLGSVFHRPFVSPFGRAARQPTCGSRRTPACRRGRVGRSTCAVAARFRDHDGIGMTFPFGRSIPGLGDLPSVDGNRSGHIHSHSCWIDTHTPKYSRLADSSGHSSRRNSSGCNADVGTDARRRPPDQSGSMANRNSPDENTRRIRNRLAQTARPGAEQDNPNSHPRRHSRDESTHSAKESNPSPPGRVPNTPGPRRNGPDARSNCRGSTDNPPREPRYWDRLPRLPVAGLGRLFLSLRRRPNSRRSTDILG